MTQFHLVNAVLDTQPTEFEFSPSCVYVRKNFRSGVSEIGTTWVYEEAEYTPTEYMFMLKGEVERLQTLNDLYLLDMEYRLSILEQEAQGKEGEEGV